MPAGRPKGGQKYGGRQKGTKNKKPRFNMTAALDLFKREGFDPFRRLIEILPQLEPKEQARCLLELGQYVYIKPTPEHAEEPAPEPEEDACERLTDEQLEELVKLERSSL